MAGTQQNENDSIMWAIKNGDLDQVKELVEQQNVNVNQEISARCPIHYASDYGQAYVLEYLLSKGADANVCDSYSTTKYHSNQYTYIYI